jgi:hypothetical protein
MRNWESCYLFTNFRNHVRIIIFISRRTSQITFAILDVKFGLKQREKHVNKQPSVGVEELGK